MLEEVEGGQRVWFFSMVGHHRLQREAYAILCKIRYKPALTMSTSRSGDVQINVLCSALVSAVTR